MNKKMLALYGLKWNPFAPDVPVEALHVSRRIEAFCWRVEQLVGEGGFALVTGAPGVGKSVSLRILAERLGNQRDVKIGIISRPQSGLSDFYREMGDLFGVELRPANRWGGAKLLRDRWQTHIDAALSRPVLIVDEAQEMLPAVLGELRLLSSARLDSHILLTGAPGTGKSVTLRILAERLGAQRDVKVGILTRPQAGLPDFYREMGDLFNVELRPANRWGGAKLLRDRWQTHIDAALSRPVLIVDEAQEMLPTVLAELRLLSSAKLDSHILLTVVLAGDGRLLERLRSDELMPLNSRMRVRLALERATPDELAELVAHTLQKAGAVKLMTPELIATIADHAQGNPRALMNIAGELLSVAAQREARQIDEKLFLEICATPPVPETKTARQRR